MSENVARPTIGIRPSTNGHHAPQLLQSPSSRPVNSFLNPLHPRLNPNRGDDGDSSGDPIILQHTIATSNNNASSTKNDQIFDSHRDTPGGMRVGRDFQAKIPQCVKAAPKEILDMDKALLVWSPNEKLTDDQVEDYLNTAKEKYGYAPEQALGLLFRKNHDVTRATGDLKNFTPNPEDWTLEDKVLFEQEYKIHGKEFDRIRQKLPDKSISSLIRYYYKWKKLKCRSSVMDRRGKKGSRADEVRSELESPKNLKQSQKKKSPAKKRKRDAKANTETESDEDEEPPKRRASTKSQKTPSRTSDVEFNRNSTRNKHSKRKGKAASPTKRKYDEVVRSDSESGEDRRRSEKKQKRNWEATNTELELIGAKEIRFYHETALNVVICSECATTLKNVNEFEQHVFATHPECVPGSESNSVAVVDRLIASVKDPKGFKDFPAHTSIINLPKRTAEQLNRWNLVQMEHGMVTLYSRLAREALQTSRVNPGVEPFAESARLLGEFVDEAHNAVYAAARAKMTKTDLTYWNEKYCKALGIPASRRRTKLEQNWHHQKQARLNLPEKNHTELIRFCAIGDCVNEWDPMYASLAKRHWTKHLVEEEKQTKECPIQSCVYKCLRPTQLIDHFVARHKRRPDLLTIRNYMNGELTTNDIHLHDFPKVNQHED